MLGGKRILICGFAGGLAIKLGETIKAIEIADARIIEFKNQSLISEDDFNNAIDKCIDSGLSKNETLSYLNHLHHQQVMAKFKERLKDIEISITKLKSTHIEIKPTKSLEEKYRDKYFSQSTWHEQKRPWGKVGRSGKKRTLKKKNYDTRKNNQTTRRQTV